MMTRLHVAWRDLGRIVKGTGAFLGHLLSSDRVEISLGLFRAESSLARPGEANRYYARITNVSGEFRSVTLVLEIARVNGPCAAGRPCVRLAKGLTLPPGRSTVVEIRYDWLDSASLLVDGAPCPPEQFWRGEVDSTRLYSVLASVVDPLGRELEKLEIYQELAA